MSKNAVGKIFARAASKAAAYLASKGIPIGGLMILITHPDATPDDGNIGVVIHATEAQVKIFAAAAPRVIEQACADHLAEHQGKEPKPVLQ